MSIKEMISDAAFVFVMGLFFVGSPSYSFADDYPSESKISKVTVYPGSARVTRQVETHLSMGAHNIILENIVPYLDENSLMVTGAGKADVKIFGASIKRIYLQKSADKRVKELEALIEKLSDDIQMELKNTEVLRKEMEYLDSVKLFSGNQVPKDLVTAMPSVENLDGIRQFLSQRYHDVERNREAARVTMRELNRELEVARRQLQELRSLNSQQQLQIAVELECMKPGKFTLDVSYLVSGAYWKSIYDARADYDQGKVELTSFGVIKQTTGEDWENVELTLSTAQPTVGGKMPYVAPWIVQPYQVSRKGRMRVSNERAMNKEAFVGGQVAGFMDAVSNAPSAPMELEQDVQAKLAYSQVEQKGVSVTYKITRLATIKSDGTESKYPVTSQVLEADFEYSSYPRLKPFAYLGSRVTNSPDIQLLAGQVNLFLDGDYIGKSGIENVAPGEEFNLYLGVDENVKVKREQISRKVDDVLLGGIKSPNRKTTLKYKLIVENYKNTKITVHLFEAIPTSQDERIKIKTYDVSLKPADVDWEDRKGVWRWEFPLVPNDKQEIYYSLNVDHPRDMNIPGI